MANSSIVNVVKGLLKRYELVYDILIQTYFISLES